MPEIMAITMPKWGLTMTEGKVLGWLKHEGDAVTASDELLEIETTKITNVMEAGETGTLRRIVAQEGATLPIGALMAVVATSEVPDAEIDAFVAGFVAPEAAAEDAPEGDAPAPQEVAAGNYRLRYLEMGNGDGAPIVFIHGFGGDLNAWMFNQPALAEGHRTIALDLPGHGASAKDVGAGDAAALAGAITAGLTALGIARAHFVGHSMGGALALWLAVRHPGLAASLSLIAPAGLGSEVNAGFIDGFVRLERRREAGEVLSQLVHDPALIGRSMVEEVLRYKRLDGVGAALRTISAAWFADGRQKLDLTGEFAALTTPVQIVWGRDDRIIPVAHAEALQGKVRVHILDATGHLPHMEKSAEVNRLIAQLVDS